MIMKMVKNLGLGLMGLGLMTSAQAWTQPTHTKIVKDALKYMGSEFATAQQRRAYDIYVDAAGSEEAAANALGKAVSDVDDFEDTNLGAWYVGYNYQPSPYSLGGIVLSAYGVTVNYTSYWHFLDLVHGEDAHGNAHGGYYSPNVYRQNSDDPAALEDLAAEYYLSPYKLKDSDYKSTEAHYRQGSYSSYSQYQNFDEMPFQPVDHLGMYWYGQFKTAPTFAVIGYSLHAIGDASQPHHVHVSLGYDHAGWEEWVDGRYTEYNDFTRVTDILPAYNAQKSFQDITLQTGNVAINYPQVLTDDSFATRDDAASSLIPTAIAASVTVLTKGINYFYGEGGE